MRFELMTYRFIVNTLTHSAMLLGHNFGKENTIILYLILLFICIGSTSKYGGVPKYHLKQTP